MTVGRRQIPVLLTVDAEPCKFFIPRDRPDRWLGFERALDIMRDVRPMLAEASGRAAHFTWLVRADPQVEEVYGSADWALETYRRQLDALEAEGDEVGLHVHAYRWDAAHGDWIEDFGDQDWVAHCVQMGFGAFETARLRRPAAFSMGMDWTNQATMDMARTLGVRWELSLIPGTEPQPMRYLTGAYTGIDPDCRQMPRQPYQPLITDFRQAAAPSRHGMWVIPLSSHIAPLELSRKRRLYNRLLLRPTVRRARKFFLNDAPASMRQPIDTALCDESTTHLTFSVRSEKFSNRRAVAAMRKNLEFLLTQTGGNVVFATPDEVLRALEFSSTKPQSATRGG